VLQEVVERDAGNDRRRTERLFHRDLPGGGYVAIELTMATGVAKRRVRVIVERRANRDRRAGHSAPVILEEEWRPDRGFGDLYRVACDNVAVARELLKLQRVD
jgi:hypothetical protein